MVQVAVLIAVHNRKEKTLACLRALQCQVVPWDINVTVFLVDDGSTDGTGDAVRKEFPEVRLIQGDGTLYWCGAMRWAFASAFRHGFDHYLWLNDDTILYPNALATLLTTAQIVGGESIVVGSTVDPETHVHTYGGVRRVSRWHPLKFGPVVVQEGKMQVADTMNGNCVLIPHKVASVVGNLSQEFRHGMGDFDYGLRARRNGFAIWVAPAYVGTCPRNNTAGTWLDETLPFLERVRKVLGPKGLPPREWMAFSRRHAGLAWPLYWLLPYIRIVLTSLWRALSHCHRRTQGADVRV